MRADDLAYPGDDMILRVHRGNYTMSAGFSSAGDAEQIERFRIQEDWDLQATVVRP